jgi:arginine repressor
MNITGPPPENEVSTAPWIKFRRNLDKASLVRTMAERNPGATANELVEMFAERGIQVSGIVVARELQRLRASGNHNSKSAE